MRVPRDLPPLADIPEDIGPRFWEAQTDAELPAEPTEQVSVSDVLRAFRKGVEERIAADDHESHCNLGLAFFEMGLLDEAIEEFEIASADSARGAECRGLIGLCFRAQGHNDRAIQSFASAIKTPGISDGQKAAFFFELAVSLAAAGERSKAAKMLQQVRSLDPRFSRTLPEDDDDADRRDFRSVREAFAGGGSRDAYVQSRGDDPESRRLRDVAALEASLRVEPENVRARITLAGLCVKIGRTTDAAHHYLLAGADYRRMGVMLRAVAAYDRVLRLGIVGLFARAHRGLADLCDELGTAEGDLHRREAEKTEAAPEMHACSFCDLKKGFARPPARGETATVCAECLFEARDLFAWTPTG